MDENKIQKILISKIDSTYDTWPDIISFEDKLLCTYSETVENKEWSETTINYCVSKDDGVSWEKFTLPYLKKGVPFWYVAKFLKNYEKDPIIFCSLSEKTDGLGEIFYIKSESTNWLNPETTGLFGILSGSPIKLKNGRVLITTHRKNQETGYLYQNIYYSDDFKTWKKSNAQISQNGYNFCDSQIMDFNNTLILFIREKSFNGWDLFKSVSTNNGNEWSIPEKVPFRGGQKPFVGIVDNKIIISFSKDILANDMKSLAFIYTDAHAFVKNHRTSKFYTCKSQSCSTLRNDTLGYSAWTILIDGSVYAIEYNRVGNNGAQINGVRVDSKQFIFSNDTLLKL
jgi:hypothetical protein